MLALKMLVQAAILLCISASAISVQEYSALDHIGTKTPPYRQTATVQDLIKRLIGSRSVDFDVEVDPSIGPKNRDTFKLINIGSRISITGTSGVAAAWGFYYYISQYCGCHVSWGGDQLNIPDRLPSLPSGGLLVTSNDRFRYYQNVCTVSYSFAWYNWSNWEREIDWMALNGINFPLAFNGQEAIWQRVYLKMGFKQTEIDGHFGGPAFLAWSRMGNMRGWGGPLPQSWHDQQVALQHKVLQRMRDFGMIPVLPAFNGDVPDAITRIFPTAKVSHLSKWGSFNATYCCTTLLDLNDPHFQTFGKAFLDEYIKEFGTDHVYNTDTFNEMDPTSSDPAYLASAGKAVYNALLAGDPQAIWVMQGWMFLSAFWQPTQSKALLTSVPLGRMIVLDLSSEVAPQFRRLDSYYGQPFIWCMLHDYGGVLTMYGVLDVINEGPSEGRSFANSTMLGIGLTMEGINQNYVVYEFMLENGWRQKPRNVTKWIQNYSQRRYGVFNGDVDYAWQKLKGSVYNCTTAGHQNFGLDVVTARPSLYNRIKPEVWYDPEEVFVAWDHFLLAPEKFSGSKLFKYDLVDVTRQSLSLISIALYNQMLDAYTAKNLDKFRSVSKSFLTLILDMDDVLYTDEHFLLGRWLESAKALATNEDQRKLYEYNARNQITLWGPDANILDYAKKQWAGLMSAYYYPRWYLFIEELQQHWNDTFNEKKFNEDVFKLVEVPFTFDRSLFPTVTTGKQIDVATRIHKRYRSQTVEMSAFFHRLVQQSKKLSLSKDKEFINESGKAYLLQ